MQSPNSLQSVVTYPVGAGLGQRIVIDGPRGAIFEYDSGNNLVGSWASSAGTDPYGHPYPAGFSITTGTISGNFFVINSSGFFIYSGPPALGNLTSSATSLGGTDPFGNVYTAGFSTYGTTFSTEMTNGAVFFTDPAFTANAGRVGISSAGVGGQTVSLTSGNTSIGVPVGSFAVTDGSTPGGLPQFAMNGQLQLVINAPNGQVLTLQNLASGPSNSTLELIANAANDNVLGIMVAGDTFNRIRFNTNGFTFGSGSATQDTQFYRSAPGIFGADTILADIGGSAEVWHTLGTPGITGWTSDHGRYRLANDGCVEFDIILHSNAVAHASSINTYPNTLPAAYQPAVNRVLPLGIDTTITAGDPFPRLAISTAGVVKIAIPSVAAVTTEIGGTLHMTLD